MASRVIAFRQVLFQPASCGSARNMATLKEISIRLKSVKNIQKITKSMKMVSAAKYAKAERELKPARAYGEGALASPRSSPVHVEDHVNEQKMKVKSMEKELHEKEQYLKALRAKDGTKNGLKTKYIRHLELKVLEQEEQLKSLRSLESELFNYRVENEKLVLELQKLRSMFALKHQQLSDATARVDWLTTQLAQTNKGEDVRENFGVPTTRMSKEETSMGMQSDVQRQRGLSDQHSSHLAGQHQGSRLTEEQLLRLQANMLRNKAAMMAKQRSSSAGNCVNLEHVILQDNDELSSLLSWQDDEENDTETSADSGHVSVDHDSPSYCNGGVRARFQFNANPPRKYFGKVECFDMDEDFRSQTHGKHLRKDDNTGDDASYQLHNSVYHGSDRRFSRTQPNYTRPLFVQTNMEHTARGMLPFMRTQSIHDSPQSTSSLSSQSSVAHSDGEAGGGSSLKASSRKRTNSFPNRDASRSALSSKKVQLSVKQTNAKTDVLEVNPDRTLGSISHYQRNKDDSESPVSKERLAPGRPDPRVEVTGVTQYHVSDSKFEANSPATNPPTKDCLNARSKHFTVEGHLSPRVTESTEDTPLGIAKSRKGRTPVVKQPVSSPGVQDLLDEIPSLKVTTRELKPLQIQTRAEKDSEKSDRTLLVNTESKTTPVQSPSRELKITPDDKSREFARVAPRPVPRKRPKKAPVKNFGDGVNVVLTSSTTVNEPVTTSTEDSTISNDTRSQDKNPSCVSHEESKRGKPGEHRPATKDVPDGAAAVAGESSLRKKGPQGGKKSGKRVSLDPHAVLLHASLEGELDLVKNIIHQVEDPSYPNTEGLTALHNSVCNSHDDIVKFLVEYGCDINAADMQGWTSLHCAAANNSVEICKFLVTHGACVFAVTAIEGKTPSRCCEKDADNFQQCFSYLSDLENNFGVSNDGVVYAVYAYQANRKDELSFECGERLTIIRRGDVTEKEWWWARDSRNQLGYVPRNLLGGVVTLPPGLVVHDTNAGNPPRDLDLLVVQREDNNREVQREAALSPRVAPDV